MELKMKDLENCFKYAATNKAKFIAVAVKNEDSKGNEIIINPTVNFKDKLAYYKKAYDDNLVLKNCNKISITNFAFGNSFYQIQEILG